MKTPQWHGLLKKSVWLAVYIHGLHLGVIVTLLYFPLSQLYLVALCLIAVVHWYYALRRYSPASPYIERIEFCDEHWSIVVRGQSCSVVLKQATVWPWLITMSFVSFDDRRQKYHCVIFSDSMDTEVQRQLRVMLNHFQIWN
jgi:hypothetical protein